MKIIIIAPDVSSKGLASSFRVSHIIDTLLKKGYLISLFTYSYPVKVELTKYENLSVTYISNIRDRNFVVKAFSKVFGIPDPLIFWGFKVFMHIYQQKEFFKKFDFSLFSSPPHSLHVIGIIIKKTLGIPFFSDFRDDWMGSHRLSHFSKLHKFFSGKLEKSVIQNSLGIFNAIPIVANDFSIKYPKYSDKIFAYTNGFNNKFKERLSDDNFGEKYDLNTIVYCGGGYDGFINKRFNKFASELIEGGLDTTWKIITAGPGINVEKENIKVWKHNGVISPDRVEEIIKNATIHISLLPDGDLVNSRTIPLKMYSQVATKGSIIFIGNEGITNKVFKNIPGIFFLDNKYWDKLSLFIKNNQQILTKKYNRDIDKFNFENILNGYTNTMEELLKINQ